MPRAANLEHASPCIEPARLGAIAKAACLIAAGRLVALPTETVYGLAGDAGNDRAIAAIFAVKNRPTFNPLIVHVPGPAAADRLGRMDGRAVRLAARFWPGPLTLVLPRRPNADLSLLVSAGLDSVALRAPAHSVAQTLLRLCGRPLAAPSANPSGRLSPTSAAHVAEALGGRVDLILDGGPCPVGIESTVLDLTGETARLLRPGAITLEQLKAELGRVETGGDEERPSAPGQLPTHYAPDLPLRLNARDVASDEALLAFGPSAPKGALVTLNLSPAGDLGEAAAHLFAYLRELDRSGARAIAAMPIPEQGLGRAINDRLRRASAPR
ncbi:MAG TPA: L-threonylcarbamoyladenylate synthase [Alphaproteobacteria bacterium]|nr:L-threonylcarbamoyladenylate synthase [Alphaproteobacteria bacterium]